MKRSKTVALLTMGASAMVLTACSDPNAIVETAQFETVEACIADGKLDRATCSNAHATAVEAYDKVYPKYKSREECEEAAGAKACEVDRPMARDNAWRPMMIGFLLGSASVQPQAVVPSTASPSGRATASGAEIKGAGNRASLAQSAGARPTAEAVARQTARPAAPTTSRGGFGGTASTVSAGHAGGSAHAGG